MQSRWNEQEAQGKGDLDLLIYASRLIGAEGSLVLWGGGNASAKVRGRDFRGRETDVMWFKGSRSDLKTIEAKHFAGVVLEDVRPLATREKELDDDEMVAYLGNCLTDPKAPRPSIETRLHGFLTSKFIIHTHADLIQALTNNERGHQAMAEAFGADAVVVPYQRPGFKLRRMVHDAVAAAPNAPFRPPLRFRLALRASPPRPYARPLRSDFGLAQAVRRQQRVPPWLRHSFPYGRGCFWGRKNLPPSIDCPRDPLPCGITPHRAELVFQDARDPFSHMVGLLGDPLQRHAAGILGGIDAIQQEEPLEREPSGRRRKIAQARTRGGQRGRLHGLDGPPQRVLRKFCIGALRKVRLVARRHTGRRVRGGSTPP